MRPNCVDTLGSELATLSEPLTEEVRRLPPAPSLEKTMPLTKQQPGRVIEIEPLTPPTPNDAVTPPPVFDKRSTMKGATPQAVKELPQPPPPPSPSTHAIPAHPKAPPPMVTPAGGGFAYPQADASIRDAYTDDVSRARAEAAEAAQAAAAAAAPPPLPVAPAPSPTPPPMMAHPPQAHHSTNAAHFGVMPQTRAPWMQMAPAPSGVPHRVPLADHPQIVGDRRVHFVMTTTTIVDLVGTQGSRLRVTLQVGASGGRMLHIKGMSCFVAHLGGRPSPALILEQPGDLALVTPRAQEIGHVRVLTAGTPNMGAVLFPLGTEIVAIALDDCMDPILFDFGPGSDAYFVYTRGRVLPKPRR